MRVVAGGTDAEFGQVGLADDHVARLLKPSDDLAVVRYAGAAAESAERSVADRSEASCTASGSP
jgi:hypothetical protein